MAILKSDTTVGGVVVLDGLLKQAIGTLPTTGWVAEGGQYYYQITIANMTANSIPQIVPQWTNQTSQQSVWNMLQAVESFDGYVRVYASAAFTTAINYVILY